MTPNQLIEQVKLRMDDKIVPRVFNDDDILIALNDAQNEFAQRTLCLSTDESIVQAPVNGFMDLPNGTLWLTSISIGAPLRIVTEHELEFGYFGLNGVENSSRYSNWRQAVGQAEYCLPDYGTQKLRLIPKPSGDITLDLEYYHLPKSPISLSPLVNAEIPTPYHSDLVIGALAYLFDVPDQEQYNEALAVMQLALWQKRINIATRLLQTLFRMQTKHITPPPGIGFVNPIGN